MNVPLSSDSDKQPDCQVFLLDNRLDELTLLNAWIKQCINQFEMSSEMAFRLELVLVEVVTNIIKHAYPDRAKHEIVVTLQHQQNKISVQIQDDGLPFDLFQKPQMKLPDRLEEAQEGGLGIPLIRYHTDEYHYRREKDKNILTIVICDSEICDSE